MAYNEWGLTPLSPPLDICPVMVFCKCMKSKQVKCGHGLIDQVLLRTGLIRAYCLLRRTWDREPNQLGLVDFRYISAKPYSVYGCCSHRPPTEVMAQSKSFFDDVKKELECPVCQEHFSQINEPKILKCLHTFCKTCLEAWIRQHRERQLSCPTCRQITECPNSNINSLPSNLFYKQIMEIMEAYSGQGEEDSPHCGLCGEKKALKFYCFECNSFLCNDCVGVHKKGKIFSGHHVKDIGNFESSDMNDYARRSNYCKTHIKEIRFYCERCQSCICIECAILEHQDHNKISLDQGLENIKSEIGIKVHGVQETWSRLRNYKVSLEKRRRKVDTSIEEATKEVKRVAERFILLIRQHEASVTEKLTAQRQAFKGAFDGQMSKLDGKMMEIDSTLAFSEDILLRNNLPEILNVKSVLQGRLQELSLPSQFFEGVLKLGCSGVKYVQSDVSLLRNIPGKLVTSNTEPSLTVAEGQNLTRGVVGADCTFTVTTKNAAYETTYCEIDEVHAKITSLTGREKIGTVVTDLKDGRYSVSYIPTTPGEFTVAIEVAGNPIIGSPFKLIVVKGRKLNESFKRPSARKMMQGNTIYH